jgi:endonuclease/exonuclease/phosphatase family metal-dependent hydrolase
MTPKSLGYTAMTENFVDVNAATVKDIRSTYHGYKPEEIVDMHIDYCFINEKVTPINRKLIDATFDGKFPSDHYGIYMEVEI